MPKHRTRTGKIVLKLAALSCSLSVLMNSTLYSTASATSLNELESQKTELDSRKEQLTTDILRKDIELKDNDSKIKRFLNDIRSIDLEIESSKNKLQVLEDELFDSLVETSNLYMEILDLQHTTTKRDNVLRERVRQLQLKDGKTSYLDVILGADNLVDFFDRFATVKALLVADRRIIEQQGVDSEELLKKKDALDIIANAQRDSKAKIDILMSSITQSKSDKSKLIEVLEKEQSRVSGDKEELEQSFEEADNLSSEIEQDIIREQERISKDFSSIQVGGYCTEGSSINQEKFARAFISAGVLSGKEQAIISTANKYSVDPVLMAAIILQETGNGKSNALNQHNNPGGIMDPSTKWSTLLRFESIEAGLESMGRTMNTLVNKKGKKSIDELGASYAPIGADNDPMGLNAFWVVNVTKKVEVLGGLTTNCDQDFSNSIYDSNSDWIQPASGQLTSQFGWRTHPIFHTKKQHRGLDIANVVGTPVSASKEGIVTRAGVYGGFGNVVMITHNVQGQTFTSVYAHLSAIDVTEGQQVDKGQRLGAIGTTGNSTGPHLHFEIHEGYFSVNGPSAVNPIRYVNLQ